MEVNINYNIIKSLHIISMTTWMAGLFYLPRLFVYHSQCDKNGTQDLTFRIMEKKLYKYIMSPSLVITWVCGLVLTNLYNTIEFWLLIKFILVLILTFFHIYCGNIIKVFNKGENKKKDKYYRIFNEVPTILFIFIIFLVVFKPII